MDLSITQLRMLHAVAATGTISAAATRLGYTPSAVSQQLGQLERSTGVAVLERVGRNVRLTDAGRELVGHAADLLARFEMAETALTRSAGEVAGRVELSLFESVARSLVVPTLLRLAQDHPGVELRTRQVDDGPATPMVVHGLLDAAFVIDYTHSPVHVPRDLDRVPITVDRFHVVAGADSDLGTGPIPLARIAGRRLICPGPENGCGRSVRDACAAAGFEAEVHHEIDDYAVAAQMAAAGLGIALIPDLGLPTDRHGIRVLDLTEPLERRIEVVCRLASRGRPALEAVIETLRVVAAEREKVLAAAA